MFADKQRAPARFRTDIIQNATNAVTGTEVFARKHIFTQDNSLSIAT